MGGKGKMQRRLELIVSFILTTLTVHLASEQTHVCMLKKRPDPSDGGDLRWSLPNEEICTCRMVVTLTFLSDCDQREDDYGGSGTWFIYDPQQLTMQHNWKKNILDQLLGRTQFCADECEDGTENCDTNAICINTLGSYNCQCNAGYSGNGITCTDIDECITGDHTCSSNAFCINTASIYTCNCKEGYIGNGFNCTDVDECADDSNNCDNQASCTNTGGSFNCHCNTGYHGDGVICTDVNECTDGTEICASTATCTNTDGSYTCHCDIGYIGNGLTCSDVDECTESPCASTASCTNTVGSFICQCDDGYIGDGIICTDIDECTESPCASTASCTNTVGSFICQCDEGYIGDGLICTDVNECTESPCASTASCTNTMGSFMCQCDDGYIGDGIICTDVDECTESPCASTASCTNTVGSFVCQCDDGYIGDGFTCTVCSDYLGMEKGDIPNANIQASSADVAASGARLNLAGGAAWRALETDPNRWIQADIGYTTFVSGVIVQGDGDPTEPDYIKTFKVSTSESSDMTNQVFIKNQDESIKIFTGNSDATTPVTRTFPEPINAQIVRIHCLTRIGDRWRLRFEIIGCKI